MTIADQLQLALQLHRAGQFLEAEPVYRRILQQMPDNADALHLLGYLIHQTRRDPKAIELISRAIAIDPKAFAYRNQLALVLLDRGDAEAAAASFQSALALSPSFAEAHNNLGNALQSLGRFEPAIRAHRQAVAIAPHNAEFHCNLGSALKSSGDLSGAAGTFRQALKLAPTLAKAHNNLGYILFLAGSLEQAIDCFGEAIRFNPDYSEAHNNLGSALCKAHRLDEAIAAINTALQKQADYPEAHYNLALCFRAGGQIEESLACLRRAIELKPDFAQAHWDLALCLLLRGELEEGWREFEWRLKWKDFPSGPRSFTQPRWDGSPLNGRTILLYAEQGLGDTVQFSRYVSIVAQRGGRVLLECQPELRRLFENLPGVAQVLTAGESLPAFDVYSPLLSLPLVVCPDSIPRNNPYLRPDPALVRAWHDRLSCGASKPRVGLVWAGSGRVWTGNAMDWTERNRSVALAQFSPVAQANCRFFSLQKGPGAAQAKSPPPGMILEDFTVDLKDFADTAALMANMDLVISVDTSAAHVAAAIGVPVWAMIPFDADWRWSLRGEQTPWYPTIRLFRQQIPGQWSDVIDRLSAELNLCLQDLESRDRK